MTNTAVKYSSFRHVVLPSALAVRERGVTQIDHGPAGGQLPGTPAEVSPAVAAESFFDPYHRHDRYVQQT
jgi:hypothetical protein